MKRFWLLTIVFSGLLAGCEKAVDFELDQTPDKLVVEATIENGQPPVVVLTKSLNYFSKISPGLLAGSFVHDAVVEMSNGNHTHRLKEYTTSLGGGYNLYYYSIDSANLSSAFTGVLNTSYSLKILSAGEEYSANTTIPNITKRIDSLWWRPMPKDSVEGKVVVMIRATDRPGFGDYVRYWTKKNTEPLLPGFQSVFDDLVIDGTTYDLEVEPGIDRNEGWDDEDRAFRRGDTVLVKLSNIDKTTYDFWRTIEYNYTSVGNPFSTPIKVLGNISNGALGYFGGYASQYRQLIIPR